MFSDNKNVGGSTDLVKKRHRSADLHNPYSHPQFDSNKRSNVKNVNLNLKFLKDREGLCDHPSQRLMINPLLIIFHICTREFVETCLSVFYSVHRVKCLQLIHVQI